MSSTRFWLDCFWYWVTWAVCIFWILTPYLLHCLQIYFLFTKIFFTNIFTKFFTKFYKFYKILQKFLQNFLQNFTNFTKFFTNSFTNVFYKKIVYKNIFSIYSSHPVVCAFVLFMVSFAVQKSLIRPYLFIFAFILL